MKKSNKILLTLSLGIFGFLATSQVILHYKYVNKKATPYGKFEAFFYNEYKPVGIHHVMIEDIARIQLLQADSEKLLIEKSDLQYASYKTSGDTLIIKGYNPAEHGLNYRPNYSPQDIKLFMPAGDDVYAINSTVSLRGAGVSAKASSWHVKLYNSGFYTRLDNYTDSVDRYFDTVFVDAASKSGVFLYRNDKFKNINARLDSSLINDDKAKIDSIHILTDSNSTVIVNGNNIFKLNTSVIKK
ncbi:MAG TPA: hypothetical protein VG738_22705 [Chitinophagaceae bacterium]|nr:hypothetical protein [Chitinophagaceae bacterium]